MNITNQLFLTDTYLFNCKCTVQSSSVDENGNSYVVVDNTIVYPGGGGQPIDSSYILSNESRVDIVAVKLASDGLRHYLADNSLNIAPGDEFEMFISEPERRLNAALHTCGHWLTQVVVENLYLPLVPVKGHHHPLEAYVEFSGDLLLPEEDVLSQIQLAIAIDKQTDAAVISQLGANDEMLSNTLLPKNFKPPVDKPLRFTKIGDYQWIPCGGTHVSFMRDIKSITPRSLYKKGGKIRLSYTCTI